MSRNTKDAIVIVLDVGESVSHLNDDEEMSFFQQARNCVSWILQRKIISRSDDALSIILIGSQESDDKFTENGFKNIICKFDFQVASWDMLKFIEDDIHTTEKNSDWLGGFIISIEMLKVYDEYNNICNRKIVFFSDFNQPALNELDEIISKLKSVNIDVTIIGLMSIVDEEENSDLEYNPICKKQKREEPLKGEKIVYEIWRRLPENVGICSFESALKQLGSYSRKSCRVTPWNCILDIGDVKINISLLKKTDPNSVKKFKTSTLRTDNESDPSTSGQSSLTPSSFETVSTIRDKVMYCQQKTKDTKEFKTVELKPEDTVEGFRYGATMIPFTDQDKTILEFRSGPKCFSVIGFTNITSVPYYLLTGDCSYIVVPRDKDENAEVALSAIIQAMKKMEYIAIVRRVYSDNRGLSIGILYPVIEETVCEDTEEVFQREYCLFIESAFQEEVKSISFPSLGDISKNITKEQYAVVDKLIEGMNLMQAAKGLRGEPCEAFDFTSLHDFKEQFFHYCVIQKGLHPDKPLPSSLPSYIENFTKQPEEIQKKKKALITEIQNQFKIELVKEQKEVKSIVNINKLFTENIQEKNEEDARILIKMKGEANKNNIFNEAEINKETNSLKRSWMKFFCKTLPIDIDFQDFLHRLMVKDKIEESEIVNSFKDVIKSVRQKYLKVNPDIFNWWIIKFKSFSNETEEIGPKLWDAIVSDNLGLISKNENNLSRVSENEADLFLLESATPSASFHTPKNKKSNFEPLPVEMFSSTEVEQMQVDSFD